MPSDFGVHPAADEHRLETAPRSLQRTLPIERIVLWLMLLTAAGAYAVGALHMRLGILSVAFQQP